MCGEEKRQENLINLYKYLKGGHREYEASLFLVVSSERTRGNGNGHRLKRKRFHLNIGKHYFTVSVTEH